MKRLRNRWVVISAVVAAVVVVIVVVALKSGRGGRGGSAASRPVRATVGVFRLTVQESGTVQPLNKVQILPPVGGRIDRILVREGAYVKRGQTLAWMSSSDRAVLLDNARAKGEAEVKYWEEAYQPTPIIAPADGLIIARNVVEGQTVSAGTGLYDLSDRLIVEASVDETDLGKIRSEQRAEITVDAYPDKPFNAHVMLIGHSAVKVNNVVSYLVQLDPDRTPGVLRAGMTANVNFILSEMRQVVLLPAYAVKGAENTTVTLSVVAGRKGKPESRQVTLGPTDGVQVVVTSGVKEGEGVLVNSLQLGTGATGNILGMPSRPGRQGGAQGGRQAGGRSGGGH